METISTHPGDYSQRDIDTRTKETPSTKDLEEINQAIKLLMERYEVTQTQNPFGFLWLANCVLYSVVCAFLLMKGWKKTRENRGKEKKSLIEFTTMRRGRSENNCQSRKRKSKGWKKKNRKIRKKGRKNRSQLQKECKTISVAGLISYMSGEKKKGRSSES